MVDGWQLIIDWLLAQLVNVQIGALRGLATLFWWFAKIAHTVADFLINEDLWGLLLDSLLNQATVAMPIIFQQLIFSATGIFYIALSLAGILLIIGMGDTKLAEPQQVIVWGVLVSALFVSTAPGFSGYGA